MTSTPGVAAPVMTAELFADLPDDGVRRELVEGEVRSMTPAGASHGLVAARLLGQLHTVVRPQALGELFAAETGFIINRDPDTVLAPDLAFIRAERLPTTFEPGFGQVVPDLVAEVISPSDRADDVVGEALAWLDAGVALVWVIDPHNRTVTAYRPNGVSVLSGADKLSGEDVIVGLRLPLHQLWA